MEKYSLFMLEKDVYKFHELGSSVTKERCVEFVGTFRTLGEAEISKKEFTKHNIKTIILPSY